MVAYTCVAYNAVFPIAKHNTIFLPWVQYRNPNMNNKDHLVGPLKLTSPGHSSACSQTILSLAGGLQPLIWTGTTWNFPQIFFWISTKNDAKVYPTTNIGAPVHAQLLLPCFVSFSSFYLHQWGLLVLDPLPSVDRILCLGPWATRQLPGEWKLWHDLRLCNTRTWSMEWLSLQIFNITIWATLLNLSAIPLIKGLYHTCLKMAI